MAVKKPHPPGARELAQLLTLAQVIAVDSSSATIDNLIREVSRVLHLPDCNTTRGLKQCHESFAGVSFALDALYAASRELLDMARDHLAIVVIAIYGRMGEDAVLRERILSETDFLAKAMTMIDSPTVGARVMSVLSAIAKFPETRNLSEMARFSTKLLSSAESRIEEIYYAENAVSVLRNIMGAAFDAADPDAKIIASIPRYLQFALKVVGQPASGVISFSHLVMFCGELSDRGGAFLPDPDAIDFLVACTRASDIYNRVTAQHALIFLGPALEPDMNDPYIPEPFSARVQHALQQFYGNSPRSAFTGTPGDFAQLECLAEAFRSNSRPRADIGQALARMTLYNEILIRSWHRPDRDHAEVLPACEDALRKSNRPGAEVDADILHLVRLLSMTEHEAAHTFARAALERHPSVAFFYYVMAVCGNMSIRTLVSANKGLECPSLTDFLRRRMLYLSASSTLIIIPGMMQGSSRQIRLQEVQLLLENAARSAETWMDIAPPDDPHRPSMVAIGIRVDLILRGHTMTEVDFKTAQDKLTFAFDLTCRGWIDWRSFDQEKQCDGLEKLFNHMPNAWKIWGPTVMRRPSDVYRNSAGTRSADPQAELTAWLTKLYTIRTQGTHKSIEGDLEMQGIKPGARRYCDDACQKRHWKVHREACKANRM
ncbi:hypothetical protein FB45DRAFT_1097132 [Roridomyces roridus]|uniref:MYND-type domain-containing protein n=1 Tax=Roridomyces roridus TaxID=1738132 RepID=A0AAD7BES5_9AGAR|nr:hypothetical protein FB45DRAFT_1097132 [Roridomyces roridus]